MTNHLTRYLVTYIDSNDRPIGTDVFDSLEDATNEALCQMYLPRVESGYLSSNGWQKIADEVL